MWPFSRSCQSKARLVGRTIIITGANTGIGKETARDLYRRGARVILACRDLAKANAAVEDIKSVPPSNPEREQFIGEVGEVLACKLDLSSLASVRECAKHISTTEPAVHVLINNAGVMMCPKGLTEDGFETQFGTNHLGGSINFDDLMSEKSYSSLRAYGQSKLANVLFTRELARRLEEANIQGVNTYSLHPGVIKSDLGRHLDETVFRGARAMFRVLAVFNKNVEQGAQTTIQCTVAEEVANDTGHYYKECKIAKPGPAALDEVKAAKLWDESIKYVGLPTNKLPELIEHISKDYLK